MKKLTFLLMMSFIIAQPAYAYVGPGSGLTLIGSLVALLAALVAAIYGFVWFPLKMLLRARRGPQDADDDE